MYLFLFNMWHFCIHGDNSAEKSRPCRLLQRHVDLSWRAVALAKSCLLPTPALACPTSRASPELCVHPPHGTLSPPHAEARQHGCAVVAQGGRRPRPHSAAARQGAAKPRRPRPGLDRQRGRQPGPQAAHCRASPRQPAQRWTEVSGERLGGNALPHRAFVVAEGMREAATFGTGGLAADYAVRVRHALNFAQKKLAVASSINQPQVTTE